MTRKNTLAPTLEGLLEHAATTGGTDQARRARAVLLDVTFEGADYPFHPDAAGRIDTLVRPLVKGEDLPDTKILAAKATVRWGLSARCALDRGLVEPDQIEPLLIDGI